MASRHTLVGALALGVIAAAVASGAVITQGLYQLHDHPAPSPPLSASPPILSRLCFELLPTHLPLPAPSLDLPRHLLAG